MELKVFGGEGLVGLAEFRFGRWPKEPDFVAADYFGITVGLYRQRGGLVDAYSIDFVESREEGSEAADALARGEVGVGDDVLRGLMARKS